MMYKTYFATPIFCSLFVITSSIAAAQQPNEARDKFKAGIAALKAEDFPTALSEFEASYALNPKAKVRYNIGMCQKALFQYREALETFEKLLINDAGALSAERLAEAIESKQTLEKQVAKVMIHSEAKGGKIIINGREEATLPLESPIRLNPGSHVVEARKEGMEPFRQEITLSLAEERTIDVIFTQSPAVAPTPPADSQVSEPKVPPAEKESKMVGVISPQNQHRAKLMFPAGIAALTVGVGGLVAAGVHTYLFHKNYGNIEWIVSECRINWKSKCESEYNHFKSRLRINEATLLAGYIVGGVLAVTGTVLLILHQRRKKRIHATLTGVGLSFSL